MHREGHVGAALLFYAPLGFQVATKYSLEWALWGAALVMICSTLPDVDRRLSRVKHRGITHTVYFALFVGLVLGGLSVFVGVQTGLVPAREFGAFTGLVGATAIVSHIAADSITPMGVDPFYLGHRISFGVVRAANPIANYVLLVIGIIVAMGTVGLAMQLGTPLPESVDLPAWERS